jgi:TM2 domain-containing membrane protein YozV
VSNNAPAGWYPQPDGSQRYWDGESWTHHQPPTYAQPPTYSQPPTYAEPPALPAGYHRVEPKNPALSLLASFFIPGLGTMLNGETGRGIGILVGYFVALLLSLVLIGIPFVIGLWIWGMVDAYTGAQKWNARHGILS